MGTSSSSSAHEWIAGAFVFSGRADPSWRLDEPCAAELMRIWDELGPADAPRTNRVVARLLGYDGCYAANSTGDRWIARDGHVSRHAGTSSEHRDDPQRRFERTLLRSAPDGLLPPDLCP
jgi:hypothetical protein